MLNTDLVSLTNGSFFRNLMVRTEGCAIAAPGTL